MYGFHAKGNCSSLEKLVPNLPKDKFKYFKKFLENN